MSLAFLQLLVTGDAVANHVVHADAAGMFIPAISDRGRGRARRIHLVFDDPINLAGGLTNKHMLCDFVQNLGGQTARGMHSGKVGGLVYTDPVFGHPPLVSLFQWALLCIR